MDAAATSASFSQHLTDSPSLSQAQEKAEQIRKSNQDYFEMFKKQSFSPNNFNQTTPRKLSAVHEEQSNLN